MILDSLTNIERYFLLDKRITDGLKFIQTINPNSQNGSQIIAPFITAIFSEYTTSPLFTDRFEVHSNTLDIQLPVDGLELIKYCPLITLHKVSDYDSDRDVTFFGRSRVTSEAVIGNGVFAIFFPNEPHHPGLAHRNHASKIKKLTIKIRGTF